MSVCVVFKEYFKQFIKQWKFQVILASFKVNNDFKLLNWLKNEKYLLELTLFNNKISSALSWENLFSVEVVFDLSLSWCSSSNVNCLIT